MSEEHKTTPLRTMIYYPKRSHFSLGFSVQGFGIDTPNPETIKKVFRRADLNSFHFVIAGSGYIENKNKIMKVTAGQGFFLKGGSGTVFYQSSKNPWTVVWVDISSQASLEALYEIMSIKSNGLFKVIDGESLLSKAYALMDEVDKYDSLYINAKWLEFICEHCQNEIREKEKELEKSNGTEDIVNRVMAYICENFSNPNLSIASLGKTFAISHAHLTRLFQKKNKTSPIKYLNQVRMEEAEVLILNGLSINKICENCGFSSLSYFSKSFKKFYGCNPSEYRRVKNK